MHPAPDLARGVAAEAAGTALLLAVVIGSGIMAQQLAGGNVAVALLGNTLATGAALPVLILIFGPLSGAHFNPAVTFYFAARRRFPLRDAFAYAVAQCIGAVVGAVLAHAMFGLDLVQVSGQDRSGAGRMIGEFVATTMLLATIVGTERRHPAATPYAVGLAISAGYWFTSSTSFANPAVTIARSLSDTFAGIAPASVPGFIAAQMAAVGGAVAAFGWLFGDESRAEARLDAARPDAVRAGREGG